MNKVSLGINNSSNNNKMKPVKKFTTFEDLKSIEKKPTNTKISLQKHNEFEKIIMDIHYIKSSKHSKI